MKVIEVLVSRDGHSRKYLQQTKDGHIIETGYFDLAEQIICLSSQIGCPLGCIFCATTAPVDKINPRKNFIRNLTAAEITMQAENVIGDIKSKTKKPVLFSYMGMGEPLLNYKNVVKSIKKLSRKYSNSRTTISTSGVRPKLIKKFAEEKFAGVVNLHFSLHAPNIALRKKIMPSAGSIKNGLEALKYFSDKKKLTCKVNYVLIKNINDSEKNARELVGLLKPYDFAVKLISLNRFNGLKRATADGTSKFERILNSAGIKTVRFLSDGPDIKPGCGQLRRHYYG